MKYSDLFNFQSVDRIIVLTEADDAEVEKQRVQSYVMSDDMADKLNAHLISQLRISEVIDNRGMLLVGNYGTGKSHLMSLISAIAKNADYLNLLQNEKFKEYAQVIAGKFEILRIETGSVSTPLRDIILSKIKEDFSNRGISITIPPDDQITNNKGTLKEIMSAFNEKYPGKGFFVVVDELLDYLHGKTNQQIMRDLGFMRELGEFVKESRFRIMFGLQEKLFDNPTFSFVTDTMRRIKDRYEQIVIHKDDTAYVISQRIIKKTDQQKEIIRNHLLKFCSLYSNMSEHIEEYVELYPIHPEYISVFNKIITDENRHILESIIKHVQEILDLEFDPDVPGIIGFDAYWRDIKESQMNRTDPTLKDVIDKSLTLEDIIQHNFPNSQLLYKPLAIKIIHALSIYRLTTHGDTSLPVGLTTENLRDDLCLFIKGLPDNSSETLNSVIQRTLSYVTKTVSGQFIEQNQDNGQYYLDLKKDIDYDEKIKKRADMIDNKDLNKDYFELICGVMNWTAPKYVGDFNIYQHSINWVSHNIFRRGYLFFGTPNERPTAQPPRDYYIYFIPPFGIEEFADGSKSDEIFIRFKPNEQFESNLKLYSAALILKGFAEEKNKPIYNQKAEEIKKTLLRMINESRTTLFDITYRGERKQILNILKGQYKPEMSFKQLMEMSASICFDNYFTELYPKYPSFRSAISTNNLTQYVEGAIDILSGKKGLDVLLDGFNLIEGGKIKISNSTYATYYANKMRGCKPDEVINFNDIFREFADEYVDSAFNIDYRLMSVVFLALVNSGDIVIKLKNGNMLTAANQESFNKYGVDDISQFDYIARPKEMQLKELIHLFEVLDLPVGLMQVSANRELGLEKLLSKTSMYANRAASMLSFLKSDKKLWGESLIPDHIAAEYTSSCEKINEIFGNFGKRFDKVSKLSNFTYTIEEIDDISKCIQDLETVSEYEKLYMKSSSIATYIESAELTLSDASPFKDKTSDAKASFREIRDMIPTTQDGDAASLAINRLLDNLKKEYVEEYCIEHSKKRLSSEGAKKKGQILESKEFRNLKRLREITNIPLSKLSSIEEELSKILVCPDFTAYSLNSVPICNVCRLHLNSEELEIGQRLEDIEDRLQSLVVECTGYLLKIVDDPNAQIEYLDDNQKKIIDKFIEEKQLPNVVDTSFTSAINSLMSGFIPIVINIDDVADELEKVGPSNVEGIKTVFSNYIDMKAGNKDRKKIRITIRRE